MGKPKSSNNKICTVTLWYRLSLDRGGANFTNFGRTRQNALKLL